MIVDLAEPSQRQHVEAMTASARENAKSRERRQKAKKTRLHVF